MRARGGRRYAFRAQPEAMHFNVVMLANALLVSGLVRKEAAEEAVAFFSEVRACVEAFHWPVRGGSHPCPNPNPNPNRLT